MNAKEYYDEMAAIENRRHNVIAQPEDFKGWHLASCSLHKPGVYRIMLTIQEADGSAACIHGFVDQDVLRIARERGYIAAPNGMTMP